MTGKPLRLIVGSYTVSLPHVQARGEGISFIDLDPATGRFTPVVTESGLSNPSYLALDKARDLLFAVEEMAEADGAAVVAFAIDAEAATLTRLARVPAHGDWPCHIGFDQDRRRLFLSNYLSGSFVTWPLDDQGLPHGAARVIRRTGSGPNPERQEGPHVHFALASPDGRHVIVCDAGTDEVVFYPLLDRTDVGPQPDLVLSAPPGALPRHLELSGDGKRLFCVSELGNIVTTWALDGTKAELLGHVSTRPSGNATPSASSAIRLHPGGRFLYTGNRGDDSIAVFDITGSDGLPKLIGTVLSGGATPREMAISPDGSVMVVCNQDSHILQAFSIDAATGALTALGTGFETGSPVCVLFAA